MAKPKVFVTRLPPEAAMDRLRKFCDVNVWESDLPPPRENLLRNVAEVEGLLSLLTDNVDAAGEILCS